MMRYREMVDFVRKRLFQGELRKKILKGSLWLIAGNGSDRMLRLMRNIILTRILAPEAFGLLAIVVAMNRVFESFTEIGVKKAIIQHPDGGDQRYLNGAWWLSMVRAAVLYMAAFFSAPLIADFYGKPELIGLMRIAFLCIPLNGALSPKAHVAIKHMDYPRWVAIFQGGGFMGVATTVVLAFVIGNVWALVIGFVAEAAARFCLSFVLCPFRPGFQFERQYLHALFRFARGMIGLPILTFVFMRADIFVIGKLCSTSLLGLYSMALVLVQVPLETVTSIMNQIVLPVFSKMQEERAWISRAILNITTMIAYLCFPLFVFIAFYGGDVLAIVYGPQYAEVAAAFAIIFASWMMRALANPLVQVYWSIGRPDLNRLFTGIRALLIAVMIYPAVRWYGVTGAATASLVSMIVAYVFQVLWLKRFVRLDLIQYGLVFARAFALSMGVILFWWVASRLAASHPSWSLLSGAAGCLVSYGLAAYVFVRSRGKSGLIMAQRGEPSAP